jgi:peptidoglycan/xylan/chitin deacetylase (PgdA/CDA1 family)
MAAKRGAGLMTTIRSFPTVVLRCLGMLAYHVGLANFVIALRRRAPRVLAYHACEPVETAFTRGLKCNTQPALLAKHLAFLVEHYEVVPLTAIASGAPARAIAITFDDAYQSVRGHAFPLLRQYRCPATVFVVTDAIDNNSLIWVNQLAWLLNTGGEPARRAAATRLQTDLDSPVALLVEGARELSRHALEQLMEAVALAAGTQPPPGNSNLYLSWSDALDMSKAEITFGNHTAAHPDLTTLDVASQTEEITRAERSLESHLPTNARLSALAYPFGAHNVNTGDAVAASGLRMTLAVGGSIAWTLPVQLGRTPVGESSVARLFADLEIVEPAKAFVGRIFDRGFSAKQVPREHWHSRRVERHVPGAPQV